MAKRALPDDLAGRSLESLQDELKATVAERDNAGARIKKLKLDIRRHLEEKRGQKREEAAVTRRREEAAKGKNGPPPDHLCYSLDELAKRKNSHTLGDWEFVQNCMSPNPGEQPAFYYKRCPHPDEVDQTDYCVRLNLKPGHTPHVVFHAREELERLLSLTHYDADLSARKDDGWSVPYYHFDAAAPRTVPIQPSSSSSFSSSSSSHDSSDSDE
jgi:hypothetical protein